MLSLIEPNDYKNVLFFINHPSSNVIDRNFKKATK